MSTATKPAYAQFCALHPCLPIFFEPWYLDAVVEGGDWQAVSLWDGDQPIAAWPYFEKRRLGLRYVSMPLFTKYMGPILWPGYEWSPELAQALFSGLPQLAGWDQNTSTQLGQQASLWSKYFQLTPQYLHQLPLSPNHDWRSGINRNMRRNIRKADQLVALDLNLNLADFYAINQLSFTRQGLTLPYTFEQLKRHDAALEQHQRRQRLGARDAQGRLHSVAYLIWDKQAAYYHLSGDDPALRQSGSGIWLLAQAIAYTQQKLRLPLFDFEGSMLPKVARIREQFGAERVPYYRIRHARDWRYRWLKAWKART
ncbi:MAG: GNAT family N-acetyltransferase [Bacteroidota bacterium]